MQWPFEEGEGLQHQQDAGALGYGGYGRSSRGGAAGTLAESVEVWVAGWMLPNWPHHDA